MSSECRKYATHSDFSEFFKQTFCMWLIPNQIWGGEQFIWGRKMDKSDTRQHVEASDHETWNESYNHTLCSFDDLVQKSAYKNIGNMFRGLKISIKSPLPKIRGMSSALWKNEALRRSNIQTIVQISPKWLRYFMFKHLNKIQCVKKLSSAGEVRDIIST